jgi:hypothetical protein
MDNYLFGMNYSRAGCIQYSLDFGYIRLVFFDGMGKEIICMSLFFLFWPAFRE